MDLLKILQATGQQDKIINALAGQFGLQGDQANQALAGIMGALAGGVQKNVQQEGGLESLMGALQNGNHAQYVEQPEQALQAEQVGNGILGHILGSKEASRSVAAQVEQQSGVSAAIIKQMLPVVATMAMGAMSKNANAQGLMGNAFKGGAVSGLMSMLDMNKDGSPIDDIMKIVGGMRK